MKKKALFLDRDGVINHNGDGYIYRREDFQFIPGIFELVAGARKAGYLVVVVTNQSGIGRGKYTEEDFNRLMDWVKGEFRARGGDIDAVYFCPFIPGASLKEYDKDSDCRKPGPGMILKAAEDLNIDLAASIMVGDQDKDVRAGRASGVGRLYQVTSGAAEPPAVGVGSVGDILKFCAELS